MVVASVLIHEKYSGDKNIVIVEGDHNSKRPMFLYDSIGIFLSNTLQVSLTNHLSNGCVDIYTYLLVLIRSNLIT